MISLVISTVLAVFTTSASGLIIDVLQSVPGTDLPTLRLCRPLPGKNPVVVDPLKTACPNEGSSWLWNYNSQPSDQMQTLINLYGGTSNPLETPFLLSQADYNTKFSYGFTNPGVRYQPSVFKVKRGEVYQSIDINNSLLVGDELEYFGPVVNNDADKTLRIQSENKQPSYLTRQLTDSSGNVLEATKAYPTATLKIISLGKTEIVVPQGNWLQRGAQGLTNVANTLRSGLNTFVARPLANAATYISQNTPQWQQDAKAWLGKTGNNLYDKAGAVLNNGVNYVAQPLINAGGWVDTKVANGINRAGNALDGAVDYISAPLVAGGEWVQNAANNYIAQPIAQTGQWIANTAANAYNTAIQDLNGIGPALGQGWQAAKDVTNLGLGNAGNWARGQINNGLRGVDRWVNDYPVLQSGSGMGQMVQAVPSFIPTASFPVQSGAPVVNQVNSNALPIVAPQDQSLGGSAIGATLRTGGESPTADDYPWDMSASQFFVPGQAKV
ncbi:hypothetical protein TWF506_000448 [Arthrobotrys conoides]|uniref:Uncharacterized protein n=1 Tax=Arthrobotrys conoides TaxID=74498 RepID=A0AAN8NDX9_9PEZI